MNEPQKDLQGNLQHYLKISENKNTTFKKKKLWGYSKSSTKNLQQKMLTLKTKTKTNTVLPLAAHIPNWNDTEISMAPA